jgi:hypothetical protein
MFRDSRVVLRVIVAWAVSPVVLAAQPACGSYMRVAAGGPIDLAPPTPYVEICSQDTRLCEYLTRGYPPDVVTIGYFVAAPEWAAHQRDPTTNFDHYLIAQLSGRMTAADLPGFKAYVHSNHGETPDHSRIPEHLSAEGRAGLGILDESDSSITFGTVMQLRRAELETLQLVATNSAVVVGGRMLSLYVYRTMRDTADIGVAARLAQTWIGCIQRANGAVLQSR